MEPLRLLPAPAQHMAPFKATSEMPAPQTSPDSSGKAPQAPTRSFFPASKGPNAPRSQTSGGCTPSQAKGGPEQTDRQTGRQTDGQTDSSQPAPPKGRFVNTAAQLTLGTSGATGGRQAQPPVRASAQCRPPPLSRPEAERRRPRIPPRPLRSPRGRCPPYRGRRGCPAGPSSAAASAPGSGAEWHTREGRGRRRGNPPKCFFSEEGATGEGKGRGFSLLHHPFFPRRGSCKREKRKKSKEEKSLVFFFFSKKTWTDREAREGGKKKML